MLDLMGRDNANAVRVSLATGLRIGDVLALKRANLSPNGEIRTICDKTGKAFAGAIPSKLAAEVLRRSDGAEWVFPSPSPRRKGLPRTRQAVWRDVKRAAKLCASPRNVSPHTARKIFAVEKFRKNGLSATQEALQHDHTETTLLYAFSDLLGESGKPPKKTEPPQNLQPVQNGREILAAFVEAFGGEAEVCKCLAKFIDILPTGQN